MNQFSLQEFLDDLKQLCAIDSGHYYGPGCEAIVDFFEERYRALGLKTERRHYQDNTTSPFLLVSNSDDAEIDVLFVAHMDTVFTVGTAGEWPLTVDADGIAHGPGCADCKGGCLSVYYLLRQLIRDGKCNFRFRVAMNSDEENRSDYSRAYFEELARSAKYCFVYEPGRAHDEFVSQRKGSLNYVLKCHGVSAHAGVDPEKGASAILELARWVNELDKLVDYEKGTSLNVGTFTGGTGTGSVPDYAECALSYRYLDSSAEDALEALLQRMRTEPFDPRTSMETIRISQRPAMVPHEKTMELLQKLEEAGQTVGQKPIWIVTGGGSDGNFIAPYGVATLDGCGPCGGNLHTRDEYLKTQSVEPRLDIMAALLQQLFP